MISLPRPYKPKMQFLLKSHQRIESLKHVRLLNWLTRESCVIALFSLPCVFLDCFYIRIIFIRDRPGL